MSTLRIKKLYIRKRTAPQWLVFFLLVMPFAFGLLIDLIGFPTFVRFFLDFALVGAFYYMCARFENRVRRLVAPVLVYFCLFGLYLLTSYLINYQSALYFIWGFRNNFRFFFAFLVFITFIDYDDAEQYLKYFDVLFWVNFAFCLIQFFFMGYKQDYLGGLFGVSVGCNVYLNVFLCIVTAKSIIYFLNKQEKIGTVLLKLAASFYISAIAELKFFFIEFIIMLCIISLITKFTWKKVGVILIGLAGVVVGISLLVQIFPEYVGQFTLELLYESASSDRGYTSSGDINRLSAISSISKMFFTQGYHYFIGFGLGNCDLSSFSFFNTPFYERNQTVNYNWFSHAFVYLETGYIGLILFFGLFVLLFILARKSYRSGYADPLHCLLAMTIALMCIIMSFYNATHRSDAVYMLFFVLALPFISKKPKDVSPLAE